MRFTREIPIASVILSILFFWQPTLADSEKNINECPGGNSQNFILGGELNNPPNVFNLKRLESLPSTEETVTFQTSSGPQTVTYKGVLLWDLINDQQAGGGLKAGTSGENTKNSFLRQYVLAEATDCYGAVVSIGEIDPSFENKQVLVAYAEIENGTVVPLTNVDEGFARLVVPGDTAGGRYVSNVRNILIFSAPPSPLKPKDLW
jgi:hypothetical protein